MAETTQRKRDCQRKATQSRQDGLTRRARIGRNNATRKEKKTASTENQKTEGSQSKTTSPKSWRAFHLSSASPRLLNSAPPSLPFSTISLTNKSSFLLANNSFSLSLKSFLFPVVTIRLFTSQCAFKFARISAKVRFSKASGSLIKGGGISTR